MIEKQLIYSWMIYVIDVNDQHVATHDDYDNTCDDHDNNNTDDS